MGCWMCFVVAALDFGFGIAWSRFEMGYFRMPHPFGRLGHKQCCEWSVRNSKVTAGRRVWEGFRSGMVLCTGRKVGAALGAALCIRTDAWEEDGLVVVVVRWGVAWNVAGLSFLLALQT